MKTLIRLMLLCFVIAGGVAIASADMPGYHPTYVHALSDLRDARAHLDYHTPNEKRDAEEDRAIQAITGAIDAAKRAAIEDGKDVKDALPVDVRLPRTDRYHKALELLGTAHRDVSTREDNPRARELQSQAIARIDEARHIVEKLIERYH